MAIDIRNSPKVGEVVQLGRYWSDGELKEREFTLNLYNGNAYLVAVYEYTKDGKEWMDLHWFFVDNKHMRRCLGLTKRLDGTLENMFAEGEVRKLTLYKNCREYRKIKAAFAEAFDNLPIEVKEEE